MMYPPDEGPSPIEVVDPIPLPETLTPGYIRTHRAVPIHVANGCVTVAAPYDADRGIMDDFRVAFRVPEVRWRRTPDPEIDSLIERALAATGETVSELVQDLAALADDPDRFSAPASVEDLTSLARQPPVVKLVNLILLEALDARASDVHLEAHEEGLRVRLRVDGVLSEAPSPPGHLREAIISRVKIMAGLDIAERRAPQDGRVRLRLKDREIDVRVASLPTVHGESVVLRLLDPTTRRFSLEDLGMDPGILEGFDRLVRRPYGIVLVTGPTGAGKTTTLYAALDRLRTGREKIVTVEDPVEYRIPEITQVQVNRAAGVTFATALRSILRQDPDVILVGEMRDAETAEIAVHAALTGHLVLSTVHTNDAATGITRLLELGLPGYLVASSVQGILAQRLVRRLCPGCVNVNRPAKPDAIQTIPMPDRNEAACDTCRGSRYRGRVGIFELLIVGAEVRREILSHRGSTSIREIAVRADMTSLREDGLAKVARGMTSVEEVERATRAT